MVSTTSQHHDSSDDQLLAALAVEPDEVLAALAGALADDRVRGTALLLSGTPRPPRAIPGNPPRSAQKNRDQARSDPERTEKR